MKIRSARTHALHVVAASMLSYSRLAHAQQTGEAVMYPDGNCHYIVPSGSRCYRTSGECYLGTSTFLGNFKTDCNADGSVGTQSVAAAGGRATPDTCALSGESCASLSCCSDDENLVCQSNLGHSDVCCHSGSSGINGGCANYGNQDCCRGHGGNGTGLGCNWSTSTCQPYVGWTAAVFADAFAGTVLGQSVQARFNSMLAEFTVPSVPAESTHIDDVFLWIGFETADQNELVQPELYYHGPDNSWQIQAQVSVAGHFVGTGPWGVAPGDTLGASMQITEGDVSGDGDYWTASIWDLQSGVEQSLNMYDDGVADAGTGSGNPAFTIAIPGILEVMALTQCDGLPLAYGADYGGSTIQLEALTEEGTAWNDYVDVLSSVSYETVSNGDLAGGSSSTQPGSPSPARNYHASFNSPYSELTWNITGP